mmetsp:Transcript_68025/g.178370  ORF Transcript_68025/g.178370 Transcript_68025/m.178370 type:complete len:213 (-) Transcript_68025:702-1340(-)
MAGGRPGLQGPEGVPCDEPGRGEVHVSSHAAPPKDEGRHQEAVADDQSEEQRDGDGGRDVGQPALPILRREAVADQHHHLRQRGIHEQTLRQHHQRSGQQHQQGHACAGQGDDDLKEAAVTREADGGQRGVVQAEVRHGLHHVLLEMIPHVEVEVVRAAVQVLDATYDDLAVGLHAALRLLCAEVLEEREQCPLLPHVPSRHVNHHRQGRQH